MKIPSNFFSNGGIEKLRKTSRGIGPRNLVSKNQLLSSKIAGCRPRTDTHAHTHAHTHREKNSETPFFCSISLYSDRVANENRSTYKNKGGLIVKDVLERTAKFGVENYLALQERCTNNWNFHNSFFFAGTVATTIGYGNITPATANGKLFCIIFTIIDTVRRSIVIKISKRNL